jgi:hypothetical protein
MGTGMGSKRMDPVTEEMDPELTVRGRMHWVGVMKDWEWESMSISLFYLTPLLHFHFHPNAKRQHKANKTPVLLG